MALTQQEIAAHLEMSQKSVSEFVRELPFDYASATLDQIRSVYIKNLRAQAAGHRSAGGDDLVYERVLTERVDREAKIWNLAEKKKQLINIEQLESALMQMFTAFKIEMLGRDRRLKADIDAILGCDFDIKKLNEYTVSALSHFAQYLPSDPLADSALPGDTGPGGINRDDGMGD